MPIQCEIPIHCESAPFKGCLTMNRPKPRFNVKCAIQCEIPRASEPSGVERRRSQRPSAALRRQDRVRQLAEAASTFF